MSRPFAPGDRVHSAFGKGIVRDVRNGGRILVEVQGRALLVDAATLEKIVGTTRRAGGRESDPTPVPPAGGAPRDGNAGAREVDLHGMRVAEAIVRVEQVLDGAIRDDVAEVRIIHGRSGGTLRAAVHRHLRAIASVRAYALDPRNAGVTIVRL